MALTPEEAIKKIEDIRKALRSKNGGGVDNFHDWIKQHSGINSVGLTKSNLTNTLTKFKEAKLGGEESISSENQDKIDRLIDAHSLFKEWNSSKFRNCNWFFYYFAHVPNSGGKANLSRLTLSIEKDGKTAHLKNVSDSEEEYYDGEYFPWPKRYAIFELTGRKYTKKLYLMFFLGATPRDLALGIYLTSNFNRVISGTVVLQYIEDLTKVDFNPILMSYNKNRKQFDAVPGEIKRFLHRKTMNFLSVPQEIYDTIKLGEKMDRYAPTKSTLFFSDDRPIVFISSPSKSISKTEHRKNTKQILILKKRIKKAFPDLKVKYPGEYKEPQPDPIPIQNEDESKKKIPSFIDNLDTIKKTTFFIFIYSGSPDPSACIMEMSWALISSKVVFLIYTENTIPEILSTLSDDPRMAYTIPLKFNDLEKDIEKIWKKLEAKIYLYLKKIL